MSEVREADRAADHHQESEESEDHPFSWILTGAGCAAVAGLVHTSLWDDQVAGSNTSGRYQGLRALMQDMGPTAVSVFFGLLAAVMLLVGVRKIREMYRE